MRKILSAVQVREADQHTIREEPVASIDLMERASLAFVHEFTAHVPADRLVHVVCGPGNNGGDGFAIARILLHKGYDVCCYSVNLGVSRSVDAQENFQRLEKVMTVHELSAAGQFGVSDGVIIDALFGSGLNRVAEGLAGAVIDEINASGLPVVSVDIPSGLFADEVNLEGAIVKASLTVSFQLPKLSFLVPESGVYTGEWVAVDIGLDAGFLENAESDYWLIEENSVKGLLPDRPKFGHKGDFGRVQLVAGSIGKMGAAALCGEACLKSGAGLLTVHTAGVGLDILQTVLREAMVTVDRCENHVSKVEPLPRVNVVCAGPGLGTHQLTAEALVTLIRRTEVPMVLDADALNIIAQTPGLLKHIPQGSVLTPHVGEFERLFGKYNDGLARIEKMREVAVTNGLVLVLKGAHTAIVDEEGQVYFNTTGNSGMATAGSGDVLAGVITGLMSQGLSGKNAALAGVFLHGMAGDLAQNKVGKTSLVASNLLSELPKAFNNVALTSLF